MDRDKIRVGIIGANAHYGWSMRAHLPALRVLPEYELTAVCTAHKETAEESAKHYGARLAFHDYKEMVGHPDIDLVVVSVKAPLHHCMVKAAIEAGKHVFCEWPLGANLEETEELAELARSGRVRNMVCLQARGDPVLLRIKELLAEGYVGDVLSCNMTMFLEGIRQRPVDAPWMADRKQGAHTLSIGAGHAIDALCFCVDEFEEVSAHVTTQTPVWELTEPGKRLSTNSPDNVLVSGVLTNGAVASVHVANVHWHGTGWRMEVYGKDGALVASSREMVQYASIKLMGRRADSGELAELPVPDRLTWVPGDVPQGRPFNVAQLYHLLHEAIQQQKGADPDFDLAVKRYRTLDSIQRSSDQGAKVTVS